MQKLRKFLLSRRTLSTAEAACPASFPFTVSACHTRIAHGQLAAVAPSVAPSKIGDFKFTEDGVGKLSYQMHIGWLEKGAQ